MKTRNNRSVEKLGHSDITGESAKWYSHADDYLPVSLKVNMHLLRNLTVRLLGMHALREENSLSHKNLTANRDWLNQGTPVPQNTILQ